MPLFGLLQSISKRGLIRTVLPDQALAVEIHEDWIEVPRYLNMEMLRE
jgi:hypothetical protein